MRFAWALSTNATVIRVGSAAAVALVIPNPSQFQSLRPELIWSCNRAMAVGRSDGASTINGLLARSRVAAQAPLVPARFSPARRLGVSAADGVSWAPRETVSDCCGRGVDARPPPLAREVVPVPRMPDV